MKKTAFALFATMPMLAQAHVGSHAHDDFSVLQALWHLLADPTHLVLLLMAGGVGAGLSILRRQRASARK